MQKGSNIDTEGVYYNIEMLNDNMHCDDFVQIISGIHIGINVLIETECKQKECLLWDDCSTPLTFTVTPLVLL